ncbi:alpha/beta fold hydrolase [Pseudalkalibacillus sp. R45]|uniref:alpha/beta fold hydrolase n=1 Tax=Pseudalkalibacillus sp. R45 TaxID=3457433 RepID=UPI003FCD3097
MSVKLVLGRNISVEDKGEGIPIVFLHPPGLGKSVFMYQSHLSTSYRIITYDMCGHGFSDPANGQVTIESLAEELLRLLDELQVEKAVICGYSAGGSVAQYFAITYPDRVLGLILSGGFPYVKTFLKAEFLAGMKLLQFSPALLSKILVISHGKKKEEQERLWKTVRKTNQKNWYNFYQASYNYSCLNQLTSISVPVLVIYGDRVVHIKNFEEVYRHHLQQPHIAIVKNAFHEVPIRKWNIFNHLVHEFISAEIR